MFSRKIQRQVKRSIGVDDIEAFVTSLRAQLDDLAASDVFKGRVRQLLELPELLHSVGRAYDEYEDRFQMAERNIDLSSNELFSVNDRLMRLNGTLNSMLDSLGEGYFIVNAQGCCDSVYSRICETIFRQVPTGVHLFDLLRLTSAERETMVEWLQLVFSGRLSVTDINELGPKTYETPDGRSFRLRFSTIQAGQTVHGLVVVATDQTKEVQATKTAGDRVEEAQMVMRLAEDKELFQSFLTTARDVFATVSAATDFTPEDLTRFRRDLHTLKGGAATFHMSALETQIHAFELDLRSAVGGVNLLETVQNIAQALSSSLHTMLERYRRILGPDQGWLDDVVVSRRRIAELVQQGWRDRVAEPFLEKLLHETLRSDVADLLAGFDATIKATASRCGKSVESLKITASEDLRIAREPYRRLFTTLVHIFRNAVDHGLEAPEERKVLGKPAAGQIQIRYGRQTGKRDWWLEIEDDGRGINVTRVRARLQETGREANALPDEVVLASLFEDSLSTREGVTQVSGLGVGLNALGQALKEIGGRVSTRTRPGQGTVFRFELPWLDPFSARANAPSTVELAVVTDLNLRYNEMISEVATLVRESSERQRLDSEIEMARAVQKAIMPAPEMEYGEYAVAGRCYAAESCGGDWWFHARTGNKLLVWIGDVLGHDIAAALVASACRATVQALLVEDRRVTVSEQMAIMNDVIFSMTGGDVYLTGICLELNLETGDLEVGSASHPPFLLLGGNDERPSRFELGPYPPLGRAPGQEFPSMRLKLAPGQGLFLMTDGLWELPTARNVPLREPRLVKMLARFFQQRPSAQALIADLDEFVFTHGSGKLIDDITYVALHRKKAA